MRRIDRLELISIIGRELQKRMTYDDIRSYLEGFKININVSASSTNSKWVYVKELLSPVDDSLLLKIADELEIPHNYSLDSTTKPSDCNFWIEGYFRLFLSHISDFKKNTALLQKSLLPFGISAFVAHEDIEPTKEWQSEIEKALFTMDALAAILMNGFKESNWCDQEVGAAIGRNLLIIPLRKGIDPYGFLGKYQGLQTNGKNVNDVAKSIFNILINHSKTSDKMYSTIIGLLLRSNTIADADAKLDIINSIKDVPIKHIERIKEKVLDNEMINNSDDLIDKLNVLLEKYGLNKISKITETVSSIDTDDLPF